MAVSQPVKRHAFGAGSFLLGVVCTGLVGIPTGLYVSKRANTAMVVQQTTISQLQTFESTGGQLDNAVRRVSDALAKHKNVSVVVDNLRDAIGAHSSSAFALRDKMGPDYAPYMAKARELRTNGDKAATPQDGVVMWQTAIDLIAMRQRISDRINDEATK